ncbi:MAG: glycosyltransferase family 39 protein [Candidatus Peribacteraceae bacterium]|nr:glycosyltransferase family 39 protein [Candidatus Peribacteraceae bacterium]
MKNISSTQWAIIFALVFFCIQLTQISAYGASWDELLHYSWAQLIWRFISTGKAGYLDLLSSNGLYYGPTFYLFSYFFASALSTVFGLSLVVSEHIPILITASIGVFGFYLLSARFYAKRVAGVATFLLCTYPAFIAHSHYNPKDIPLLTAFVFALLSFDLYRKSQSMRTAILAGFAFGLAVLFKMTALFLLPIIFIAVVVDWMLRGMPRFALVYQAKLFFSAVITTCVTIFVLWPTLWLRPMVFFSAIKLFLGQAFWHGKVLYFGTMYESAQLPWHYTIGHLFLATPVLLAGFFLIGTYVLCRSIRASGTRFAALLILLWVGIPLTFSIVSATARYDGMRQFLFVVPAILLIAACGIDALLALISKHFPARFTIVMPIISGLIVLSLGHEILLVHPYEGSYVNELIRLRYPSHIEKVLEIEYWGSTYKEGIEWLSDNVETGSTLCVRPAADMMYWYAPLPNDMQISCDNRAQYLMFFTRFSALPDGFDRISMEPIFRISRMNSDLLLIYKLPPGEM